MTVIAGTSINQKLDGGQQEIDRSYVFATTYSFGPRSPAGSLIHSRIHFGAFEGVRRVVSSYWSNSFVTFIVNSAAAANHSRKGRWGLMRETAKPRGRSQLRGGLARLAGDGENRADEAKWRRRPEVRGRWRKPRGRSQSDRRGLARVAGARSGFRGLGETEKPAGIEVFGANEAKSTGGRKACIHNEFHSVFGWFQTREQSQSAGREDEVGESRERGEGNGTDDRRRGEMGQTKPHRPEPGR